MWRSLCRLCSKVDLDGNPSKYYPRFRPRRLVMPVDPSDVHSSKRQNNQLLERYKAEGRKRRNVERRGAFKLASVPPERSVGDAFRVMLEVCESGKLHDPSISMTPSYLRLLEELTGKAEETHRLMDHPDGGSAAAMPTSSPHTSPFYSLALDPARYNAAPSATEAAPSPPLSIRQVDLMWDLLNRTPLNSPVHGVFAQRGKSLVESTISGLAYRAYPRLRSRHLQQLLHETCGLLPCGRVAIQLGFAEITGIEAEIGMWRELNVLTQRFNESRRKAAVHLERVHQGVAQQRRWYWKAVLRSAAGRLKLFPVAQQDLQPRMEWARSSVFAFIAFAEMAERSGDTGVRVVPLIEKLFCSQLGQHVRARELVDRAAEIVRLGSDTVAQATVRAGVPTGSLDALTAARTAGESYAELLEKLRAELTHVQSISDDEKNLLESTVHPLNHRADLRREQFASSGGAHAMQNLRDDLFEEYQVVRHRAQAPAMMIHALRTPNAFKEAQLILKYAPHVSASLRNAPIDVDQVVRKVVEVHETNNYATLHNVQQYRQVEYTVCRLFCGKRCIGEGKGETLMEAMQEASQDMVLNYYFNRNSASSGGVCADAASGEDPVSRKQRGSAPEHDGVRVCDPKVEEDIAF